MDSAYNVSELFEELFKKGSLLSTEDIRIVGNLCASAAFRFKTIHYLIFVEKTLIIAASAKNMDRLNKFHVALR